MIHMNDAQVVIIVIIVCLFMRDTLDLLLLCRSRFALIFAHDLI